MFGGKGGRVLVIGIWLGTYIIGIVIIRIMYIGLVLVIVIIGILICLLGGSTCRLGIFPHFVLGLGWCLRIGLFGLCDRGCSW